MNKIASKIKGPNTVFGLYMKQVLKHPWLFTCVIVGVLVMQAADLISPLYMKEFFNTLVANNPDRTMVHGLLITIVILAVIALIDWVATRLQIFSLMYLESKVMVNLYEHSFDYLIRHSHHFFSSQFSGTLTRRVGKFAESFESLFDTIMMQFFPTTLFVVGAITILFIRNQVLGLILLVWSLLFVGFQLYVAKLRQPLREARSAESSKVTGNLSDAISNHSTIALFAGSSFENNRFRQAIRRWQIVTMRSWNADEYIWAALGFLIITINIGLLYGALYFWQRGLLTVGDFVLIQAYLLNTFQQLIGINRNLRRFYDSFADASEMITILNTPHEVSDIQNAKSLMVSKGVIEFKSATFNFNETNPVLNNFTLTIQGGEKVALVGPSGAGKSTITKLLLRFYDLRSGSIEIDGQNISKVTQDSLRRAVSFVPQEPILFHRSLKENIQYGNRDATDAEIIEAAKKAHCHDFIAALPEGYDTHVGERGVKLSGGERQRVAIARAILKNAPILVLDEATSSLDSESEALIQDALKVLMEGKTVVVIAHRLSTIMTMDRIVVIENGAVAAEGTHDELVQHEGGLYHKLWSIQAGGFIVDAEVDEA